MLLVGGICQNGRMEVSVTGMAEDDDLDIVFLGEFPDPVDEPWDISAWYRDVFRKYLLGFAKDGSEAGTAGQPVLVGIVSVFCDAGFLCTILLCDLCDLLCFLLDNLRDSVYLE